MLGAGQHVTTYIVSLFELSFQIPVNEVADDTDDNDGLLENDFFDDRHSFLNFCEMNFYRFDTLRRAKYSSMMILHHLLASWSRATETICSICDQNVVPGWHCEMCSQFYVCNACYQREGDHCNFHKLVEHSVKADSRNKSEQMQQQVASEADSRKNEKEQQQVALEADSRKKSEQMQNYRVLEVWL